MPSFLHSSDSDRRLVLNRSGASSKSSNSINNSSSFTLSSGKPVDEVVDGLMKRRCERYDYAWTKAYNKYSLLDYCEVPKLVVRQCTAWAGEQLRSVKKAIQWREPLREAGVEQRNLFNSSKSRTANYLPFPPPPPPSSASTGGIGWQTAMLLLLFVAAVLLGAVVQQHGHQTSELLQIEGGDCNIDHADSVPDIGMTSDVKMMLGLGDKKDGEKEMSDNGELDVECRHSPPPSSMEMMGSVAVPCCTVCTCKCACNRNIDNSNKLEQFKLCTSELAMTTLISQNRPALGDEQNEPPMGMAESADNSSSSLFLHGKKGNKPTGWSSILIRLGLREVKLL